MLASQGPVVGPQERRWPGIIFKGTLPFLLEVRTVVALGKEGGYRHLGHPLGQTAPSPGPNASRTCSSPGRGC